MLQHHNHSYQVIVQVHVLFDYMKKSCFSVYYFEEVFGVETCSCKLNWQIYFACLACLES